MINNKPTLIKELSQLANSRKNKKGRIARTNEAKFDLLSSFGDTSYANQHEMARKLKEWITGLSYRSRKFLRKLFGDIIKNDGTLSNKTRQYYTTAAGYTNEKTASRIITKTESLGLLKVEQYFKEANTYKLGKLLDNKIIVSHLQHYIPSFCLIFPILLSASLLVSNPSQKDSHSFTQKCPTTKDIYIREDFKNNLKKDEVKRKIGINPKEYIEEKTKRGIIPPPKYNFASNERTCNSNSGMSSIDNVLNNTFLGKEPAKKDIQTPKAVNSVYKVPKRKVYTEEEKKQILSRLGIWDAMEKVKEKAMKHEEWDGRTSD